MELKNKVIEELKTQTDQKIEASIGGLFTKDDVKLLLNDFCVELDNKIEALARVVTEKRLTEFLENYLGEAIDNNVTIDEDNADYSIYGREISIENAPLDYNVIDVVNEVMLNYEPSEFD